MNSTVYEATTHDAAVTQEQGNVLDERAFVFAEARKQTEYAFIAMQAETQIRRIARENIEQFFSEAYGATSYPNDSLGYHRRYIEVETNPSSSAQEIAAAHEARLHNVRTDFGEKMQAMTWDLPEPRAYDFIDGKLYDGGYEITPMLHNGLSALNNPVEGERRVQEAINFSIIEAAGNTEGVTNQAFIEISMCNHEKGTKGYVTDIDKMQIRYSRYFDTDEGRKLVMQPAYIDGRMMDDSRMARFLSGQSETFKREEVLGRMLVVDSNEYSDVIDFVQKLDEFAAEESGLQVFMGQHGGGEYADLPEISRRRYALFEAAVIKIDAISLQLAREDLSAVEAELVLEEVQKRLALELCALNPGLASTVFNAKIEAKIAQFNRLKNCGDSYGAGAVFEATVAEAPDLQGCGAACGLRDATGSEANALKSEGIGALSDGTYKVDKVRPCPGCGAVGGITYGANGAFCANCRGVRKNGVVKKVRPRTKLIKSIREVQQEYEATK